MEFLNYLAAIAAVFSTGFAIFAYIKDRRRKIAVKNEMDILSERMKNVSVLIEGVRAQVDELVQYPKKDRYVSISSMQQIARYIRQNLKQIEIIISEQEKHIEELRVSSQPPKKQKKAEMANNTRFK